ncbi:hypothetical protein ACH5RR_021561 [Cinchona calisaya]|uniref:Fcf2 pre-rRNA processing C-terminal domain-containing protein n=1 Tax=Cinchona calisaya TaxID=153742 RepID=A0ABD2ZLH2_9GENT
MIVPSVEYKTCISFAILKDNMSSLGNRRVEHFEMGAGANEPTAQENVQMASESTKRETIGLSWEPKIPCVPPPAVAASGSSRNHLVSKSTELIDGLYVPPNDPKILNKLFRKSLKDTAGKHWFDMPAPTLTPDLKKDLRLLKLRSALDPKRHYKKGDSRSKTLPKYFQVGTVIESASEFYTGRLTKKERKATLADELLSDSNLAQYRKRKVQEIEEQNRPGGVDQWKIRGRQSMKRTKQRRH